MTRNKMDRRGSGPLWFVILVARRSSCSTRPPSRRSTADDCGTYGRKWQIFPPEWECDPAARLRVSDEPAHWFEPVADHLARPTCATRSRRAPSRRSAFLRRRARPRARACGCSTSGAARAATPTPSPRGASRCVGVDISQRFVDLAAADAPPGATFERVDARPLPFDGRVRRRHLALPGRLRPRGRAGRSARRRRRRARRDRPGAAARRPGRRLRVLRLLPGAATSRSTTASTPTPASTTSAPRSATRPGAVAEADLWTTCFTPRELRLLAGRGRPARSSTSGRSTPARTRPRRPRIDTPELLLVARRP